MIGYMCWLPKLSSNSDKILHLRLKPHEPWKPYTAFPQHSVPDYRILGGSKGWATYQKLLQEGWALIATVDAYGGSLIAS
jgi:hypothetical protein